MDGANQIANNAQPSIPATLGSHPPPAPTYRSFNGRGNNLVHPLWGSAISNALVAQGDLSTAARRGSHST